MIVDAALAAALEILDQIEGQVARDHQLTWEEQRRRRDPDWYQAYLRSHHWRRFRKRAVEAANYACIRCGRVDPHQDKKRGTRLHVHHLSYSRIGNEQLNDVSVECWRCHGAEHPEVIR